MPNSRRAARSRRAATRSSARSLATDSPNAIVLADSTLAHQLDQMRFQTESRPRMPFHRHIIVDDGRQAIECRSAGETAQHLVLARHSVRVQFLYSILGARNDIAMARRDAIEV